MLSGPDYTEDLNPRGYALLPPAPQASGPGEGGQQQHPQQETAAKKQRRAPRKEQEEQQEHEHREAAAQKQEARRTRRHRRKFSRVGFWGLWGASLGLLGLTLASRTALLGGSLGGFWGLILGLSFWGPFGAHFGPPGGHSWPLGLLGLILGLPEAILGLRRGGVPAEAEKGVKKAENGSK